MRAPTAATDQKWCEHKCNGAAKTGTFVLSANYLPLPHCRPRLRRGDAHYSLRNISNRPFGGKRRRTILATTCREGDRKFWMQGMQFLARFNANLRFRIEIGNSHEIIYVFVFNYGGHVCVCVCFSSLGLCVSGSGCHYIWNIPLGKVNDVATNGVYKNPLAFI